LGRALLSHLPPTPSTTGSGSSAASLSPSQVSYFFPEEKLEGLYEAVESRVVALQKFLGTSPPARLALVVEDALTPASTSVGSGLKLLVDLTEVAALPAHHKLFYAHTAEGIPVMVVHGIRYMNEGLSFTSITLPIRVLYGMGVERVAVVTRLGSLPAAHVQAGQCAVVLDHLNLTGRNPLYGPNEDRWGVRFPDMSNTYCPELRAKVLSAAKELERPCAEAVAGLVVGPVVASQAEMSFYTGCGADVVTTGAIPEIIVARHMGMKVCVFGPVLSLSDRRPQKEQDALASLLAAFFRTFYTETK